MKARSNNNSKKASRHIDEQIDLKKRSIQELYALAEQ